jgi:hypothetical protein
MKVALCFWGLCRSLEHTIESINDKIIKPLQEAGIDYTIFLHTYTIYHRYNNTRAGEENIYLNNTSWKLLNPTRFIIENQDVVDKMLELKTYRKKGDPWKNECSIPFSTLDNHIRALWSLKQVTSLWNEKDFDKVIYLRPDVHYSTTFNTDWLSMNGKNIVIPNFHIHYNCNDRFAIGNPSSMKIYGNRFDSAYYYSLHTQLHAERFLNAIMNSKGIYFNRVPFIFRRIRANGKIFPVDLDL